MYSRSGAFALRGPVVSRPTRCVVASAVALALGTLAGCTGSPESTPVPTSQRASQVTPTPSSTVAPTPTTTPTPSASSVPTPEPTAEPTAEPAPTSADPVISPIGDRQWALIERTGTWRPGCPVGREDLRRLDVNFVDFDGNVKRGSLVANSDTIDDLAGVFTALFDAGFPIAQMTPVERYDGDVVRSLTANNTSAFNCRKPGQINAPVGESPHANGRAIDINPYQNPWVDPRCDCWVPSGDFAKRRNGPGVITEGSLPWRLLTNRGWIWQDIKVPDYMHFDTGYPSRPRPAA